MIVEFIGTPGAGKTMLLPVVADFFKAQGYCAYSVVEAARPFAARTIWGKAVCKLLPARWQRPLLWQVFYHLSKLYRLRFFLQNPQLMWMVARFQRQRPIDDVDRRHVLYWFYHQVGYYAFLKAHALAHEVLLFDEGFIHRVVQHYASETEEPDLVHMLAYIERLPRPDLVIHPIAAEAVCEQRVYDRGLWQRFQHKSAADISCYMAHAHAVVQETVQQIKRRGWMVIEVHNDGVTAADAATELRRKLTQLPYSPQTFAPVQIGA